MARRKNKFDEKSYAFSALAIEKLRESGIDLATARQAGIICVENARRELGKELAPRPALVIPYFDLRGDQIYFWRDGEKIPFFRVRYLGEPRAQGFIKRKSQRYAQLKGSGTHPYLPPLYDWRKIAGDPKQPIMITEGELKALKACQPDPRQQLRPHHPFQAFGRPALLREMAHHRHGAR